MPNKVTTNLGRVSIVPKGPYDAGATYDRLDVVSYNDNGYVAKHGNLKGIEPSDGDDWMMLVGSGSARLAEQYAEQAKGSADAAKKSEDAAAASVKVLRDNEAAIQGIADNLETITDVHENMDAVTDVHTNMATVQGVNKNMTAVQNVNTNMAAVQDVHTNMSTVQNVNKNMETVQAVEENMAAVQDAHTNMAAIKDAPAQAKAAEKWSNTAKSYAVGEGLGDERPGEATDNAAYYYDQTKRLAGGLAGGLVPMGTVKFADLKDQTKTAGYMYNISDAFTTDDTFEEGTGHKFPAGTNVYWTGEGKWDILSGLMVTGVKGHAEPTYRMGDVDITPANIGLGSVDNTADSAKKVLSATKLTTARQLGVDLARTEASTFDGAANQLEIPVKGVLPVANGGTARTTIANITANLASNTAANALAGNIGVSGILPVANGGTGNATGTAAKVSSKLTFTGSVTVDYDGSAPKSVAIPTVRSWTVSVAPANWVAGTKTVTYGTTSFSCQFKAVLTCTGVVAATVLSAPEFISGDLVSMQTWAEAEPGAGTVTLWSETKPEAAFTVRFVEVK